jgi:GMP synthase-like glutamine amidotransferase
MILIVDMNYKKDSLGFYEFALPIVSVIKKFYGCEIKHYSEIDSKNMKNYDKVILSGTTLKNMAFSKDLKEFEWVKSFNKPILGICAGMQIIGLLYGSTLEKCQELGLFSSKFAAYELHNFSIKPSEDFEVLAKSKCVQAIKHKEKKIYGVLFHPEVRNKEILEKFLGV